MKNRLRSKPINLEPLPQINFFLGLIFTMLILITISGCSEKKHEVLTLKELEKLNFKLEIEGVNFDVPVLYHYNDYEYFKIWPLPKNYDVIDSRESVDVLKFQALLPGLLPYSQQTAQEFELPGHQNILRIYMQKKSINWEYYFDGAFKRLLPLPPSKEVRGMYHFMDPLSDNDMVYLSNTKPTVGLKKIRCLDPRYHPKDFYPSCTFITSYDHDKFQLELTFRSMHLAEWESIEAKAIQLLDQLKR